MTAISSLEDDILSHEINLKSFEWNEIKSKISEFSFTKKSVIFSQTHICDKIFFISDGIAASEQIMAEDPREIIPSGPYFKDVSFNYGIYVMHVGGDFDSHLLIPKV